MKKLTLILFATLSASFAFALTPAQQQAVNKLNVLSNLANQQTNAYTQAVNGYNAKMYNTCLRTHPSNYCANQSVRGAFSMSASQLATLKNQYPYAGMSTVIQHTLYDVQHPGSHYSDSNFSLYK